MVKKIFLLSVVLLLIISVSNAQDQSEFGYSPPCDINVGGVEIDNKCFDCGNDADGICPDVVLEIDDYCGGVDLDCETACESEPLATTCGTWICGTRENNCGEMVTCIPGCSGEDVCASGECVPPAPSENCVLTYAGWNNNQVTEGYAVSLNVAGTDCEGLQVRFDIAEVDCTFGCNYGDIDLDDTNKLNIKQLTGTINSYGNVAVSWTTEWILDENNGLGDDDPEYVFKASLADDLSINLDESGELKVTEYVAPPVGCEDTCASLGYVCGTHDVCGVSVNCPNTCDGTQFCNDDSQCEQTCASQSGTCELWPCSSGENVGQINCGITEICCVPGRIVQDPGIGCADGSNDQQFSSTLIGCDGTTTFDNAISLCASGWRPVILDEETDARNTLITTESDGVWRWLSKSDGNACPLTGYGDHCKTYVCKTGCLGENSPCTSNPDNNCWGLQHGSSPQSYEMIWVNGYEVGGGYELPGTSGTSPSHIFVDRGRMSNPVEELGGVVCSCIPESSGATCGEDCGDQINNCGETIDCGSCENPVAKWQNGITELDVFPDTTSVLMILEDSGLLDETEVIFEIYEDDTLTGDDDIRTLEKGNAITGIKVDVNGNAIATWAITQTDLNADPDGDYNKFYFKVKNGEEELAESGQLALTVIECTGINYCSNYGADECVADACEVASASVKLNNPDITCGEGFVCGCAWDGSECSPTWAEDISPKICGDGVVSQPNDGGAYEQCDENDFGSITGCNNDWGTGLDEYTGGTLDCGSDCLFDIVECTGGTLSCGDGVVNQLSEDCDGLDLQGLTCEIFGYDSGTLSCSGCEFNTSGCIVGMGSYCGDGGVDTPNSGGINEQCDSENLNGQPIDCVGLDDYTGGTLSCRSNCMFDITECVSESEPICGDDVVNNISEDCDGLDLQGKSCEYFGYDNGGLTCSACEFNKSSCGLVSKPSPGTCFYFEFDDGACDETGWLTYSWVVNISWPGDNIFEADGGEGYLEFNRSLEINDDLKWHFDQNRLLYDGCTGGEEQIPCPPQTQLPFFNFYNVLIVLLIITLIYVFLISKKRKKKVRSKKGK